MGEVKQIKVCIISPDIYPPLYGNSRMAWELAKKLSESGCKVFALTNGSSNSIESVEKIEILHSPILSYNPLKIIQSLNYVKKYIKKIEPDIIHGHGIFSIIVTIFCKKITKKPSVQTINGIWPIFYIGNFSFKIPDKIKYFYFSFVDYVICSNKLVYKKILTNTKLSEKKVIIQPYGIENIWFKKKTEYEYSDNVVFFGDGTIERGLFTVLSSIPIVIQENPNVIFTLAIRHWPRNKLRKKALEIIEKYNSNIELLEFPYSFHISEIVSKATVVALPFTVNSMEPPISLVESMALGKAVITSDIGGNNELIKNNERGILIRPTDSTELADSILYLLNNSSRRFSISQEAKNFIEIKFEWRKNIMKIIELYQLLIEGNSSEQH